MKLKIICWLSVASLVGSFCIMGCSSRESIKKESGLDDQLQRWEEQLKRNPRLVATKIDSTLGGVKDSVMYYELTVAKAFSLMLLSELDSTILLLDRSASYAQKRPDCPRRNRLLSKIYYAQGRYYSRLFAVDKASNLFSKAYFYAKKTGELKTLPNFALNLADSYVRMGRFDLGALWYWRVLSLYDQLHVAEENRFPVYTGLANIYKELEDFQTCDSLYRKAAFGYHDMQPYDQFCYLRDMGDFHYYRKEFEKALSYFRSSQLVASEWPQMNYERNLVNIKMGEVFLQLNQTDSASQYLIRCYDYFKDIDNASALYNIDTQLIALALKEKNLPLARYWIENASSRGYVQPNMLHIRNHYLQQYFEESGNFKEAYYYQKENARIDDSIRNRRMVMRTSEVALRYRQDSLLMKHEILIRQQENKMLRLRLWAYFHGLGTLVLVAVGWGAFLYRRRKNEKKLWQMQRSLNSQRLNNVRSRISPHFIFNVLNREMSRCTSEMDKSDMLTLVRLIRRNLELTDRIGIPLSEELDFINDYLSLERGALGPEFKFIVESDEGIDIRQIIVPSMSLHLLVENAVKHSLLMKEGKRRLWLRIGKKDGCIIIKLVDNGGGFKMASSASGTGTGLKVVTQTIQLFNQSNKNPILMRIKNVEVEDAETGCEISFSIPINYSFTLNN